MMKSASEDYEGGRYKACCMKSTCSLIAGASVAVITVAAVVTTVVALNNGDLETCYTDHFGFQECG